LQAIVVVFAAFINLKEEEGEKAPIERLLFKTTLKRLLLTRN